MAERRRFRSGDAPRVAKRVRRTRCAGSGVGRTPNRTAGQHANGADAPLKSDGARLIRTVGRTNSSHHVEERKEA
jgi:hypothetical protein